MEVRRRPIRWMWTATAAIMMLTLWHSGLLLRAEVVALQAYRTLGSPWVGRVLTCRFEPSCSQYAIQKLEADGLVTGNLQIAGRLVQCSPIGWLLSQQGSVQK